MFQTVYIVLIIIILSLYILNEIRDRKLLNKVSNINRGNRSERKLVITLLKKKVPPVTIFHDLYVRKPNGKYSQIDIVVATKIGIIVIEVKDYSGWIFGNGQHDNWIQMLAYGKEKYRFYNPIKQNEQHIKALRATSNQMQNIPIYSVIVFYGNSVLKNISNVPEGTLIVKGSMVWKAFEALFTQCEPVNYTDKQEVVRILSEAVKNGESTMVQQEHVNDVRSMFN